MASFQGDGALRYLGLILVRKECPGENIESKIGEQWDKLVEYGRAHVEGTGGNAIVQTITLTLKVKMHRTEGDELACEVTPRIKGVVPDVPLPTRTVFIDRDNVAHTVPVQVDLPIMGIKGSVDGGKQESAPKGAVKLG